MLALAVLAAAGLGGCATFERGATDEVYAVSDPAGATVTVSFGNATCLTPCKIDVSRSDSFTMSFAKQNYESQSVEVKTRSTAPVSATSRDVTADYVGRIVDAQDGAHLIHVPNPVVVVLHKAEVPAQ